LSSIVETHAQTRQAQKSDQTRKAILEASMQCLADFGYTRTTMTAIAKRAGLSRGAMQYHFETMRDVLTATIDYIEQCRRTNLVQQGGKRLRDGEGRIAFEARVDALWNFLSEPESIAFFELAVAARADRELNEVMHLAQARFLDEWVRLSLETFPEWKNRRADVELACGLAQALLEGLRMRQINGQADEAVSMALRGYLADAIRDIFENGNRHAETIDIARKSWSRPASA